MTSQDVDLVENVAQAIPCPNDLAGKASSEQRPIICPKF
mgnify:CR=1 FL=1